MGKLTSFRIEFDENPRGIFMTGQPVKGRVFVGLKEPMKIRGVRLQLSGKTQVKWTEHRGGSSNRTVHYRSFEVYINGEATLYGKARGADGDSPVMGAGDYQLPFAFVLPVNCPSSFEGLYGSIRYMCTAVIDKPWKFNYTAVRPLTVVAWVDLNQAPNLASPVQNQRTAQLGFWCMKSGNISCQLKMPRTGYVPGEQIPLQLEISNESGSRISQVKISIEENVQYFAEGRTKLSSRNILALQRDGVEPGRTQTWDNDPALRVPAVAPSLISCAILRIMYALHVKVCVSGTHSDISLYVPLFIGNVPFRFLTQEERLGPEPSAPSPDDIGFSELPLPSYQDAVFGQADIREEGHNEYTMGERTFAPKYPVYNFAKS